MQKANRTLLGFSAESAADQFLRTIQAVRATVAEQQTKESLPDGITGNHI